MALSVLQAVWSKSRATGSTLVVLLALADHADNEGVCWPSVRRLGQMARISRRHVFRCLDRLVNELGEIERLGPANTRRSTTRFRVLLRTGDPPVTSDARGTGDGKFTRRMTAESLGECPPRQPGGDPSTTQTIRELSKEPSGESGRRENPLRAETRAGSPSLRATPAAAEAIQIGPGAPPAAEPPGTAVALVAVADPEELRIAWNRHAPHLIPCHGLTKSRVQLARARLAAAAQSAPNRRR